MKSQFFRRLEETVPPDSHNFQFDRLEREIHFQPSSWAGTHVIHITYGLHKLVDQLNCSSSTNWKFSGFPISGKAQKVFPNFWKCFPEIDMLHLISNFVERKGPHVVNGPQTSFRLFVTIYQYIETSWYCNYTKHQNMVSMVTCN